VIHVTDEIRIREDELEERFVRASGPGGQHVNKVATAVELRFNVAASSLPVRVKERLTTLAGARMTGDGVLLIDSREHRTQGQNRDAARARLVALVELAAKRPKRRRPTKPRAGAREGGSFSNDLGRGLANAYRVIPDAEATQRPPRETVRTTGLENSADGGALSDQNSADCGTLSDQNSAVFGTPTEKNIEEITPPSGEHAREEESSSQNGSVDKNQRVRLPSKERGLERRLAALKAYNPSAETIEFAAELAVNALDPHVLGKFIDYYCGIGKPPADCDAAYRYWMRNEWRFAGGHNARGSPRRAGRSRLSEGALNRARAYDG